MCDVVVKAALGLCPSHVRVGFFNKWLVFKVFSQEDLSLSLNQVFWVVVVTYLTTPGTQDASSSSQYRYIQFSLQHIL